MSQLICVFWYNSSPWNHGARIPSIVVKFQAFWAASKHCSKHTFKGTLGNMTPALDPKQGSFFKTRKYTGSREETESPERPTNTKILISLNKLGFLGQNLDFRGPEIEAHRSVIICFSIWSYFQPVSSISFVFCLCFHLNNDTKIIMFPFIL